MAGDSEVSIGLRWAESGADVPARTAVHLRALQVAAGGASAEVGDRLATAFTRLEAREPTMVLRRVRGEIEALGAQALGAGGPIGRLAGSLALLIPGGTTTLAAVAGFAAIGIEIKKIIEFADQLDKKLLVLGSSFAKGPATLAFGAAALRQRVEDLRSPGFFATIGNTVMDMVTSGTGSYKTSGAATERAAELAATEGAANRADAEFAKAVREEARKAERERTRAIGEATLALEKSKLGVNASAMQLFDLTTKMELLKIRTSNLDKPMQDRIELLTREARALERANLSGETAIKTWLREPSRLVGGPGGDDLTRLPSILRGARDAGGPNLTGDSPMREADRLDKTVDKFGLRVGQVIGTHVISLAHAASRGDLAGVTGAVGGGLTALSGITSKDAAGKVSSPLGALGPVGIGLSVLTGVLSLFGGGNKMRVTIAEYERQALDQLKTERSDPLSTSWVFINSPDMRRTQFDLGRLQRRDAITRLP